jgi:hypothetical protein
MDKKKPTSDNPEVQEAMDKRDELLTNVQSAVQNVDRLIQEYVEAEKAKR